MWCVVQAFWYCLLILPWSLRVPHNPSNVPLTDRKILTNSLSRKRSPVQPPPSPICPVMIPALLSPTPARVLTPFGILALVPKMWLSVNPVSHGAIVSTLTFLFMLLLTIHNIFVPTVFSEDNYMYWNVCFWYPSKYCMTKCFAWLIHLSPLLSRLICAILGDRLSNSPSHWRILYIRLKSIPPQSLYQFLLLAVVKLLHLILFVLIMHILRHVQSRSLLPHDSTSSLSFFPSPSWFFYPNATLHARQGVK